MYIIVSSFVETLKLKNCFGETVDSLPKYYLLNLYFVLNVVAYIWTRVRCSEVAMGLKGCL